MNFSQPLMIIPRSIISLIILFIITKIIGKKQVSELSLFDYVIGISIGNFTAEMTLDLEHQFINGVIAMVTFGIVAAMVSILSVKSILFRRIIFGVPTIIIQDGKILSKNLQREKFDINDLLEQARIAGYFDLSEISYAIMEVNGKISFLPKDQHKNPTKKDLKLTIKNSNLCANIIIDSKLMMKNIKNTDKTLDWFKKQLKMKGYTSYEKILLATYANNEITIYPKESVKLKEVLE